MKVVKALFVAMIVAAILFGLLPLIPGIIRDVVLITWAAAPWWGQLLLLSLGAAFTLLVICAIVKLFIRPTRRPTR